jgi:AcrR family transcriptional regulator
MPVKIRNRENEEATRMSAAELTAKDELSSYSRTKRDQIISGALKVFLKYGYEGTSMNRVAEEAGVIKQTIYSHFDDKEGLFKAIIESLTMRHFQEQFGEDLPAEIPPELALKKIAEIFLGRQKDPSYISLMRTVIGESERFPELARLYTKTVIKPGSAKLASYFKAHPELKLGDPDATARVFCGAIVNNIMLQEILYGKEIVPFDLQRIIDALIEMILGASAKKLDR